MSVVQRLSPAAERRVARESATQHSFDAAARAINEDWGTTLDGKQLQRWCQAVGNELIQQQDREVIDAERGERPVPPLNEAQLLVIGVDGGRVQQVEKNADTGSRWCEDKVLSISSYLPGDGKDRDPQRLVTTYQATMRDAAAFGPICRTEAERRGIRQAVMAVVLGDCGNWIDPLCAKHFPACVRIADYFHAAEHLHEAARSLHGSGTTQSVELGDRWSSLLYEGQLDSLLSELHDHHQRLGPSSQDDAPTHPREVMRKTIGYFETHRDKMDYPSYRKRGWPIGSGVTESAVKRMNQRVKGSEQFWHKTGVEPVLALRCLWLSEDRRWESYWLCPSPQRQAA